MTDDASAGGGPGGPGGPGMEGEAASVEISAAASGTEVVVGVVGRIQAAELTEARQRTKSGSPSPRWAAWSRT